MLFCQAQPSCSRKNPQTKVIEVYLPPRAPNAYVATGVMKSLWYIYNLKSTKLVTYVASWNQIYIYYLHQYLSSNSILKKTKKIQFCLKDFPETHLFHIMLARWCQTFLRHTSTCLSHVSSLGIYHGFQINGHDLFNQSHTFDHVWSLHK